MMASYDNAVESFPTSFFKMIFGEDSSAIPQEIAMKLITIEHEYRENLSIMEQKRSLIVLNLDAAEDVENDKFENELKKLDMEIEAYKATKQVFILVYN
jgi:hypothetical protein